MFCSRVPYCVLVLALIVEGVSAADWQPVKIPESWKSTPAAVVKEGKGFAWYRCWVAIPSDWRGGEYSLFSEAVDDAREVYLNGQRIGGAGAFPPQYRSGLGESNRFAIAADHVRPGELNVVALRVFQNEGRSGFNVAAPVIFGGKSAIRLAGAWQFRAGDDLAWASGKGDAKPSDELVFRTVEPAAEIEKTLKKLQGEEGPLSPSESLDKFKTLDDLEVELVISEPEVRQPLYMNWDERGRLWVVQFLQYPNPAGLTMLSRDKFLRAVYDQVPPAPPNHFRGADKITIHEDTDGDGRLDRHKTFVDGLSLVSSFALDKDGVWVLNPPYLLFYPDRNHDDVPDGDPVVHLSGFGIEDSHSIANSLRWGPDGWLYSSQGSTVSGNIVRPGLDKQPVHSLGQLIWRYHPPTRRYEIFAEGGGNSFGVEFDAKGRAYSGHNGGDTRGFHYVQGGYFQKGFGKHGPLSNPYTFGYFAQMKHHKVARFTHNFVIYEGGALPVSYHGKLFGIGPLQSHVVLSDVQPDGSSFQTKDIGHPLTTTDTWFRPVDIKTGPDGAVYVADMYEQRIDHASHYQGRIHKESGRIYRLKTKGGTLAAPRDLSRLSGAELLDVLSGANKEQRQTALRLLQQRQDKSLVGTLQQRLEKAEGQQAVELFWALDRVGGLDEAAALRGLDHADPYVRVWAVRLLCDSSKVSATAAKRLAELAYREPHVEVRSQLACSARRLPAADSLPIVRSLLGRSEDATDIHVPLLLWWAIEAKADADRELVAALFRDPAVWDFPLVREHILPKLLRRYALAGTRKDLLTCAKLLEAAPAPELAKKLMTGFEEAYEGRPLAGLPTELIAAISKSGGLSLALRVRQGEAAAVDEALKLLADFQANAKSRLQVAEIFGQVQQPQCIEPLLTIVAQDKDDKLRAAALTSLQAYDTPRVGTAIVELHNALPAELRAPAQTLLVSRRSWTNSLLDAVAAKKIEASAVPLPVVRKILLFPDEPLAARVKQLWGEVQGATSAQMREQVERLAAVIATGSGNPYGGRQIYRASCGKCHQLFQDGGQIGPDLTSYKRDDLKRVLLNVVNPSAEIREGFENYLLVTSDGRTLNGFIADQDSQVVTLRGVDGQSFVVPRDDIEVLRAMPTSIMPEGLLKDLSDQQIRDLFAFLRSTQPLP